MLHHFGKICGIAPGMLLLLNLSCNSPDETATAAETVSFVKPATADTICAGDRDTTILLNDGEAFVKGHIIANKKRPVYTLPGWKGQTVTAILKPSTKRGNVRIGQVQQPGGDLDGPFGDSLTCVLKANGNLRFIISENLMTGDPYTGDFMLHVMVK